MNDFVARRIGGVGWVAADTSQIIAFGTEESEILDSLEAYLGRSVVTLEESPPEQFEPTLKLAIVNTLTNDKEVFEFITQQLTARESDSLELKSVIGGLSQQVDSLSRRNAALEKANLRAKRQAELTAFLEGEGFGPQDIPLMLNTMLQREGL